MKSRCMAAVIGLLLLATGICNAQETLNVHLQDDGSLAGRLRVFYATGKSEPAEAKISFLKDGDVVNSVKTDDMGHFQLAALEPGEYVAKAAISTGTTDFAINVVEYQEGIDAEAMFLDATLTPTPDGEIIEGEIIAGDCGSCGEIVSEGIVDGGYIEEGIVGGEIIDGGCGCGTEIIGEEIYTEPFVDAGYVEEYIDPGYIDTGYVDAGCCGGGFTSGGCCGGGGGAIGGGGRLLGLAALGAAVAIPLALDDDNTPVSPAAP